MTGPDARILEAVVQTKMPYGKCKGTLIADLPVYYLEWLAGKGFGKDHISMLLATTFEIKTNGLGKILDDLKKLQPKKS